MRNRKLASPDAAIFWKDLDLRNHRDNRFAALRIGDPTPVEHSAIPSRALSGRLVRSPPGLLRSGLDHRGIARGTDVLQTKLHRIRAHRGGNLIDELLAPEMNFR